MSRDIQFHNNPTSSTFQVSCSILFPILGTALSIDFILFCEALLHYFSLSTPTLKKGKNAKKQPIWPTTQRPA
jgi:hypothetical protein